MGVIYSGWEFSYNDNERKRNNIKELENIKRNNNVIIKNFCSISSLSKALSENELVINIIETQQEIHYFIYKNKTSLSDSQLALVCDNDLLKKDYYKRDDEIVIYK